MFFLEYDKYNNMQVKESKTNWHFRISIVKSVLRIIAGIALCNGLLIPAGSFFIVAEILGIVEEL
jgi:hypothetical protein